MSSNGAGSRSHQSFAEPEGALDSDDSAGRGYFIPGLLLGVVSPEFGLETAGQFSVSASRPSPVFNVPYSRHEQPAGPVSKAKAVG